MKGIVYILYSKVLDKYYIGSTKNLAVRLDFHLSKKFSLSFTTKADDWEIFHTIETEDITIAIKIERHIKKMKSRLYINNLKKYPDISKKLIKKYKR